MLSRIRTLFKDVRQLIALVWTDASSYVRRRLALVLLLVAAAAVLTGLAPVALQVIVDNLSGSKTATAVSIYALLAVFVVAQWLAQAAAEVRGFVHARVERRMFSALCERVFAHLMRLPMRFHANRKTGAINQTLENGLQGYQMVMHHLVFTVVPVLVQLGTMLFILARLNQPVILGLFTLALLAYAAMFIYAALAVAEPAERASAAVIDSTAAMTDPLLNVELIKHSTAENFVQQRISVALARTESEWVGFYRRYARNGVLADTIFAAFRALALIYAVEEVRSSRMTIGEFVLINTYIAQLIQPVQLIGYAMQGLSQGGAMLKKMLVLLTEIPEKYLTDDGQHLRGPGRLEFEHVAASYGAGREVIRDATFTVEPGRTLGIVGASGSGKSTIVRLLTRTLEPTAGRILLDGIAIENLSVTKLRRAVGVVAQDMNLLNDTLWANVALCRPDALQSEIESAARAARLHEFILRLPEDYDTQIGERGVKLSGGERQRLAIARAILKNPLIFVFDEATSALDSKNEQAILRSLIEISKARTTLIITHRLSTVVHADEIIVLDEGRIVERGTHAKLVKQNGKYAALWEAQHPGSESIGRRATAG